MTAFISVSGPLSTQIGQQLHSWLANVLQHVEPWIAAEDINKGTQWANVISQSLVSSDCGIIVLCPDNLTRPWLMYEAGVIAARTNMKRVATLLVDVRPEDVDPPLGIFQHTNLSHDDMLRLIQDINQWTSGPLPPARVAEVFAVWWPQLESAIHECKTRCQAMPPQRARTQGDLLAEVLDLTRDLHRRITRVSPENQIRLMRDGQRFPPYAGVLDGLLADPTTAVDTISIQMRPPARVELPSTGSVGTRQSSVTTLQINPAPAGVMPARDSSGT